MRSNEHKMPVIKELVEAMGEVVTDCGPGTVTGATLNIDDVLAWGKATVDRDTGRHGDDGGAHARTLGGLANHAGNGAARRKGELEESAVE